MAESQVDRAEPVRDLVRDAFGQIQQLVRLEVALARDEVRTEVTQAKASGIALGAAAALAVSGFTLLLVAVASVFAPMWLAAVVVGGILLAVAATLGAIGWKAMPPRLLGQTRERLESDVKQLKERVA